MCVRLIWTWTTPCTFVADLRRWMNDGNLTASAARPPCGQLRWHLNRRPLPCPQEPSKSKQTLSEMTTPYGFVDAVAEQVRLRCMGSSTPHGYEVALCPSPPPARVRQRLLVHNWVGEEDVGCCQSGTTEQMWAGVAPSAMRICVTNRCEMKQRGLPTILVWVCSGCRPRRQEPRDAQCSI